MTRVVFRALARLRPAARALCLLAAPLAVTGASSVAEATTLLSYVETDGFRIVALSTRSDMVTGGDVLVRVESPAWLALGDMVVERNGTDVTAAFRPDESGRALMGVVSGLVAGENRLLARPKDRPSPSAVLSLTNHPLSGPVFSGPHEEPFFCTTHIFRLVTGELLGPARGSDCSASTRVDYVYRTTAGTLKPLPDLHAHPADLAYHDHRWGGDAVHRPRRDRNHQPRDLRDRHAARPDALPSRPLDRQPWMESATDLSV